MYINNNRSKANLINAIHQIVNQYDNCYYFPSYEIMIDELRDYRYYKEDMIHPSQQATAYIWERLVNTMMDDNTKLIISEWTKIKKSILHKI